MTAKNVHSISVVIPVRNGEAYLGEAIRSVLGQSRRPDQVIVVDDGSTDGSQALAESFGNPVSCARLPTGKGSGAARNTGVTRATGGRLAFLDADDIWMPNKLSLQLKALAADPSLDGVFGHVVQFTSPELDEHKKQRFRIAPGPSPGISAGTLLIQRDAFDRVGPFRDDVRVGEFVDWYARAVDAGLKLGVLDDVVLRRRLHDNNTGTRELDHRSDYARVLKSTLERRRAAALNPDGTSED